MNRDRSTLRRIGDNAIRVGIAIGLAFGAGLLEAAGWQTVAMFAHGAATLAALLALSMLGE